MHVGVHEEEPEVDGQPRKGKSECLCVLEEKRVLEGVTGTERETEGERERDIETDRERDR